MTTEREYLADVQATTKELRRLEALLDHCPADVLPLDNMQRDFVLGLMQAEALGGGHTGGEGQCERCLQPNPLSWFVASDIWNRVMRGGDRGAHDRFGFCCPTCFIALAREVGIDPPAWQLAPHV